MTSNLARHAYLVCTRLADKIGDVDDVTKKLERKIAQQRAVDKDVDNLIAEARAQTPPVEYAVLQKITGYSREWLRKIAAGEVGEARPRRRHGRKPPASPES